MGRVLKWAGISLCVAILAGTAVFYVWSERLIAKVYPLPPSHIRAAQGAEAIARGRHFVLAYGCGNCHTRRLQGVFIPDFRMKSRNLTRLAKTFSDGDFDRAIRRGLRPDGTSVAETMPSDAFQFIPDSDLADMIAYIRSLPPAGEDIPPPSAGISARLGFIRGKNHDDQYWFSQQMPALDLGSKFARGRGLAMAACGECHTTSLRGQPDGPPDLLVVASYERGDFFKLMRTGKAAGNREIGMMSAAARVRFRNFSDEELGAIYGYLVARGQKLTTSSQ
ncbi:MAG TPA: c-type cytochrome [Rhizomicrobium sp.]|jgi:mono/diheme cytochrome c family protein